MSELTESGNRAGKEQTVRGARTHGKGSVPNNSWDERLAVARAKREKILLAKGKKPTKPKIKPPQFLEADAAADLNYTGVSTDPWPDEDFDIDGFDFKPSVEQPADPGDDLEPVVSVTSVEQKAPEITNAATERPLFEKSEWGLMLEAALSGPQDGAEAPTKQTPLQSLSELRASRGAVVAMACVFGVGLATALGFGLFGRSSDEVASSRTAEVASTTTHSVENPSAPVSAVTSDIPTAPEVRDRLSTQYWLGPPATAHSEMVYHKVRAMPVTLPAILPELIVSGINPDAPFSFGAPGPAVGMVLDRLAGSGSVEVPASVSVTFDPPMRMTLSGASAVRASMAPDALPLLPEKSNVSVLTGLAGLDSPAVAALPVALMSAALDRPRRIAMSPNSDLQALATQDALPILPEKSGVSVVSVLASLASLEGPAVAAAPVSFVSVAMERPRRIALPPEAVAKTHTAPDALPILPEKSDFSVLTLLASLEDPAIATPSVSLYSEAIDQPRRADLPDASEMQSLAAYDPLPVLPEKSDVAALTVLASLQTPAITAPAVAAPLSAFGAPRRVAFPKGSGVEPHVAQDTPPILPERSNVSVATVLAGLEAPAPAVLPPSIASASRQDIHRAVFAAPVLITNLPDAAVRAVDLPRVRPAVLQNVAAEIAPQNFIEAALGYVPRHFSEPPVLSRPGRAPLAREIAVALPAFDSSTYLVERTMAAGLGLFGAERERFRLITVAPTNVPDARVSENIALLSKTGFSADTVSRVDFTVSKTHIRYYREEDAEVAQAIATKLGGSAKDFTNLSNRPPSGQVEIWLSGGRKAAPQQARVSASSTAAGREAALKAKLEARLVQSLRRGDHLKGASQ